MTTTSAPITTCDERTRRIIALSARLADRLLSGELVPADIAEAVDVNIHLGQLERPELFG